MPFPTAHGSTVKVDLAASAPQTCLGGFRPNELPPSDLMLADAAHGRSRGKRATSQPIAALRPHTDVPLVTHPDALQRPGRVGHPFLQSPTAPQARQ